ncbi:Nucleoside-diphosphate-sugar epimerase [Brevibacterium siliguriense]|uniref:Nucleoside-diphosphate-sugar epimerase n=1 Tax=Brevibacterium siliguriense TaxID=1136497 RepID=A0A1H1QKA7_9MICO|nr:NAD(P)-dependent oxidoreductase [Brevibacterium siliguriense]SDS23902.1 Nucleoside-diphosphate-sugar epimerase [Brevibacterium siliguriense]
MANEGPASASAGNATDVVVFDTPVFSEDVAHIASADLPWEHYRNTEVLVTGASGMIPMYIVGALLAANDDHDLGIKVTGMVRNLDKATKRFGSALERRDFSLVAGDVIDLPRLDTKFATVFHGASPARPSLHKSSPVTTLKANTLGTINLLDALVESDGQSFVLLSSSEVYGSVSERELIAEDDVGTLQHFAPRASYSEGKRIAETALAAYADEFGIRSLSLRFGHIYGPGMALDDGRVQADFLADVVRNRNVRMMSAGAATRTYTYVADAVLGLFVAHLRGDEQVYNVADPAGNISIRQLAEAFAAARPEKDLKLDFVNPEDGRSFSPVASLGLDASRLAALGWSADTKLSAGVSRCIRSFEEGPPIIA